MKVLNFPNGKSRPTKGICLSLSSRVTAENTAFVYLKCHRNIPHVVTGSQCKNLLGGKTKRGLRGNDHDCRDRVISEQQMSEPGQKAVTGHVPSRPDREVLTQEPEEVRWPVFPEAGMSPVLSCLCQGFIPHLKHTHTDGGRSGGKENLHYITLWKISTVDQSWQGGVTSGSSYYCYRCQRPSNITNTILGSCVFLHIHLETTRVENNQTQS